MKSILIITPFLPYPIRSGGEQAQFNVIETLRSIYKIAIIFPINRDNNPSDVEALSALWPEVRFYPFPLRNQYLYLPFLIQKVRKFVNRYFSPFKNNAHIKEALDHTDFLTSKRYRHYIDNAISETNPDIIQVEFIQNLNIVEFLPKDVKNVFIHHEIGFVITERKLKDVPLTNKQQQRKSHKKLLEIARLNQYDNVITVSEMDKQILSDSGVNVPVYVSPSAVNTPVKEYEGWMKYLVFLGGYNHWPNHEGVDWFLSEIVPLICWENYPQVELKIIGAGWAHTYDGTYHGLKVRPVGYVDDLAINVFGSIMIVPLLTGSGMRMKILDAAALSVPFVATSVGVEGLDFTDGESCVIGNKPIEFANALKKLMEDGKFREAIANNAHQLYLERYSLSALISKRHSIYEKILRTENDRV